MLSSACSGLRLRGVVQPSRFGPVVIEVKREMDRAQLAQVLEYAGWARTVGLDEIATRTRYHGGAAGFWEDWQEFTGTEHAEALTHHRLHRKNSLARRTPQGAYLTDPDEYRAITRNLLHQGGHVEYTTTAITVTLDRPDSPRIARALQQQGFRLFQAT